MRQLIAAPLLLSLMLACTACSTLTSKNGYFRDRTQNYVTADSAAPLKFPQGTEPKDMQSHYPVPAHHFDANKTVSTLPPDLANSH